MKIKNSDNLKRKIFILGFVIFILILFFLSGCIKIIPEQQSNFDSLPNLNKPTSGWIVIENDAETTKDCTPELTIFSEGATQMSFSGDGETWTDWIDYITSYGKFNIANNFYGTEFSSGTKHVYVRFKDEEGNFSPSDELAFDTIEYEIGKLFSIKIFPQETTIPISGNCIFTLHGYDFKLNEVPLDNLKVTWTKCCGVGNLSPTTGLSTTYTAPSTAGERNITAHYSNLQTGAIITVTRSD